MKTILLLVFSALSAIVSGQEPNETDEFGGVLVTDAKIISEADIASQQAQTQAGQYRDEGGFTAEDYEAAAVSYREEGNEKMAKVATQKAQEVRQAAQLAASKSPSPFPDLIPTTPKPPSGVPWGDIANDCSSSRSSDLYRPSAALDGHFVQQPSWQNPSAFRRDHEHCHRVPSRGRARLKEPLSRGKRNLGKVGLIRNQIICGVGCDDAPLHHRAGSACHGVGHLQKCEGQGAMRRALFLSACAHERLREILEHPWTCSYLRSYLRHPSSVTP